MKHADHMAVWVKFDESKNDGSSEYSEEGYEEAAFMLILHGIPNPKAMDGLRGKDA